MRIRLNTEIHLHEDSRRTSLVVVTNTVRGFDGAATALEVNILRQVESIGKGSGQQALSTGRKEGAADR